MNKIWPIAFRSSIITFLGMIIYSLLVPLLNVSFALSGSQYMVWGLGIYSAHYYYKVANDGLLSYRQGLQLGLMVSLFTGIFSGTLIYLYTSTTPDAMNTLKNSIQQLLLQQGSEEALITQVEQMMQTMTPSFLLFSTLVSMVFLGFLITLVVSAFSRNSQPL